MKKSQGERILAHLKSGKTLSAKQAATMFGCYRLGARIMEIRDAGYKVAGEWLARPKQRAVFTYWMQAEPFKLERDNGRATVTRWVTA